jgi:xanthine dehydrogenase accessory factor
MWNWAGKLDELEREGHPVGIVTVVSVAGSTPCALGAKMLVLSDGRFFGTVGGGHLERLAMDDARACVQAGEPKRFRYPLGAKAGQCCGGVVETFVEVTGVGPALYLFGAGHVGQALVKTLGGTPFRVHVIDEREEWMADGVLPVEVRRHACPWDEFVDGARWDASRTYVAVMTHRHDTDQDIIGALLDKPTRYLGLIGSQTKWARFKERLGARGATEAQLARVRCPIGLDIGGKAPQEVAVSVAAELLKVHHGK